MTYILGISSFYHDSAACLIKDGNLVFACQEERFTRIKHDSSFPNQSIKCILNEAKLKMNEIDYVSFYDKPLLKFERLIETYLNNVPFGFRSFKKAIPIWIKEKLFLKDLILKNLKLFDENFCSNKIFFSEHHYSHAASAFFPSPFHDSLVLTIDGVGEWATTSVAYGKENTLEILKEIHFPDSLGLLYSAFTYFLGFKVNSGEYKLMGLAPYGEPIYKEKIFKTIVKLYEDGSFKLNQKYFDYVNGLKMVNKNFERLFNLSIRNSEKEEIKKIHMDIAASIQEVIEDIIVKITNNLSNEFDCKNLCLAGGVALNCVANSRILKEKKFDNIWIQPASGDAGGSLGAAYALWYREFKKDRIVNKDDSMKGSFLGPKYTNTKIEKQLKLLGAKFKKLEFSELLNITAKQLNKNKIIGWFQGRMEFGPRALGSRSIIANPKSEAMQKDINLKIKFRENFRPFAPAILSEKLDQWFNLKRKSPYMLLVSEVKENKRVKKLKVKNEIGFEKLNVKRTMIPAVTHVDFSSRVQTVHKKTNKIFYDLIKEFEIYSKCPILVNTSFNIRGEPIVCSPEDAFNCFMGTKMDILVIGNFLLRKEDQENVKKSDYRKSFTLD